MVHPCDQVAGIDHRSNDSEPAEGMCQNETAVEEDTTKTPQEYNAAL